MENHLARHLSLQPQIMNKVTTISTLIIMILSSVGYAQKKGVCTTKFVPKVVTYNGCPDLKICCEAVERGIMIETPEVWGFFLSPTEGLKEKIGDAEVVVEVVYYEEEDRIGSGEMEGAVIKITLDGEVLFEWGSK